MPLGAWFMRTLLRTDLDDPASASEGRPVFELHPQGPDFIATLKPVTEGRVLPDGDPWR